MKKRMKPGDRKEAILKAGLRLAEAGGYRRITREQISTAAGVTGPALNYHFETMRRFRQELLMYAVEQENLAVIAQGLVASEAYMLQNVAPDLARRAVASILR